MGIMQLGIAVFFIFGLASLVGSMASYGYHDTYNMNNVSQCQGGSQLVSAELQAVQVGNPSASQAATLNSTVAFNGIANSSVKLQEANNQVSVAATIGTATCPTVLVPVTALSIGDNATVARPTPTP